MSDYTFITTDPEIQQRTIQLFAEYERNWANTNTISSLVEAGIDPHARDNCNETLLLNAATDGHTAICTLLIRKGADINAWDDMGQTPLHAAVDNDESKVVKALCAYGANIWAEDRFESTVLSWDDIDLLQPHLDHWQPILAQVLAGNCGAIKTTQDLYHLASVMKPDNPQDVPEPKEFIRELFAKYLPHDEKFNKLYSTIFNKPRGHETLAETRDAARREQRG